MEQSEIKMKLQECFAALKETHQQQSFSVDEDFYGGITVTFNLLDYDKYYATVEVKDNGVVNGQIAYGCEWLIYGVSSEYGGEYEEYLVDNEMSIRLLFGAISTDIYHSVLCRHEGFFLGDKIKFFGKELSVVKIDKDKVYVADSETVFETEVYSIAPLTGLMLSQPDTDENPIIITKYVLIR